MARVFFLAFNSADPFPIIKKLRASGHKLIVAEPKAPEFDLMLRQQSQPPEIVVCDLSQKPASVRETCAYLRGTKALRQVPFIVYNVRKEDAAATLQRVPGATILAGDEVEAALDAALAAHASRPNP